ncbi:TRAP transporter small permease [Tistrella mobilis]|uniref:TRAP transporter small permease protein n=1 Tax=Tistrella mobilis (strain KA081020-065) TaxID=1110502 RepID=I3TI08_TISMK|nr:TRAP transporter small permease [Tistrella mobilis]AFK52396.1 Tripartite ATP-independent periplasmic transporter DctQ component [Tistrella mobilis KA081020-065]
MASSPEHDDVPEAVREVDRPVVSGRIEEFIAALAMAGICVISFGNVVVRYVTNASFAATEELSIFLLVVMTMVGASLAFIRGGHIRITAIVDRLPRRPRMGLIMLTHLLTVIMFALVAWYGWLLTLDEMEYGETSPALGLSELDLHHLAAAGFDRDHPACRRPCPPGMAGLPYPRDGRRHRHRR